MGKGGGSSEVLDIFDDVILFAHVEHFLLDISESTLGLYQILQFLLQDCIVFPGVDHVISQLGIPLN